MGRYGFEQFAAVRNYADLTWSPDGRWVAYGTNTTGQYNIWKQPVAAGPGGHPLAAVQLTVLTDRTARRVAWSPDGSRIITAVDAVGSEFYQLAEVPADTGWLRPLTDLPKVRHELAAEPFSPDGRWILYSANEREPADMDACMRNLDTGEVRVLLAGDANYDTASFSPDGTTALVMRFHSNTNQDLLLVDLATGQQRLLTPHEGEVRYFPGPWARDGSGFYFVSDRGREFMGMGFLRTAEGAAEQQWVETPDWDVEGIELSHDGRTMVWVVNEDGYSRLFIRDTGTGVSRPLQGLPRGVVTRMSLRPDGTQLALLLARPRCSSTLYIYDIATGTSRALTQAMLGGVPEEAMVEPELVRYPSHDGRTVPAFLYKPQGIAPGGRVPVVLSIHGGPEAQERPVYMYNGYYQYLLSLGIGVLAPNIRGSTGYGIGYQKLIHRDWGGAELGDLEHAAKYLRSLPWVDPDKLGVFGGSFGGFATLSCVSRLPDYWAAAVDIVGPSNLVSFLRSVPPHWKRMMRDWVGDPDEETDELMARSPIHYVDQIRAPLLVIQGANDPRVVKPESDQMVERLRANGRTVEYMVFEDEGHGFTKTANSLKAFKAMADWFERYLLA